jgi:HPt (histidine-containing phosphotransfer) domain-containing protein
MHTSTPLEIKREIAHRFGGYPDAVALECVATFAPIFKEDALKFMLAMREALSRRDCERLTAAAHTMKGTSGKLGLQRLSALCAEMERLAQEQAFATAALKLRRVAAEYRQVQRVLDQLTEHDQTDAIFKGIG